MTALRWLHKHGYEVMLLALFAFAVFLTGYVAGDDMPCGAGQVYVVDTGQCADGNDHGAHDDHGG